MGKGTRKAKKGDKRREQLKQLGEAWSHVVISAASYLSYVAREKVKYDVLIEEWKIKSPDHKLVQKRNETVSELLGRHRDAKRDLDNHRAAEDRQAKQVSGCGGMCEAPDAGGERRHEDSAAGQDAEGAVGGRDDAWTRKRWKD